MELSRREALASGLAVLALLPGCSLLPVVPPRPEPDDGDGGAGWVGLSTEGRIVLRSPRQEMGQGVLGAFRAIVAAELDIEPAAIELRLPDTSAMQTVRATVSSESLQAYGLPLARAAAALRAEIENRAAGRLGVAPAALVRTASGFSAPGGGSVALAALADAGPVVLSAVAVRAAQPRRAPSAPGARLVSPDLTEVLQGTPLFVADMRPEGLLHGAMLRPPRLGAVLRNASAGGASTVPGFVAFAAEDDWAGVVAERPGALARARGATQASWEGGSDWGDPEIATAVDVDARLASRGGTSLPRRVVDGAADPQAAWDVDMRFEVPMAAHAAIEPRAAIARFSADRRRLEVWAGTQDAFFVRAMLARRLGLSEADVVVRSCRIGGAFGGRFVPNVEVEAARLARAVAPRPVLVQWSREDEFRQAYHRPPSSHRIRARLGADGRVAAWWHAYVSGNVIFTAAVLPPWLQRTVNRFANDEGVARGARPPYGFGSTRVEFDTAALPVPTGIWRGLSAGPNTFAIEGAMDALALRARQDPVAFRLAHLGAEPRLAACLRRVAEMSGWGRALPAGRALGVGCAPYKDASWAAVVAEAEADGRGGVTLRGLWCAQDSGVVMDVDRVRAQAEGNMVWAIGSALSEGLSLRRGSITASNFADYRLATLAEVPPRVEVALVDPPAGAGFGGAGATAFGPALAAIASAVSRATGRPLNRLPLRRGDAAAA